VELCPTCGWPHEAPLVESESAVIKCPCGWSGPPSELLAIAGKTAVKHVHLISKIQEFHFELAQAISPKLAQLLLKYEFVDPKKPSVSEFAQLLKEGTNALSAVVIKKLMTEQKEASDAEAR
jgi:hypothetical protein